MRDMMLVVDHIKKTVRWIGDRPEDEQRRREVVARQQDQVTTSSGTPRRP